MPQATYNLLQIQNTAKINELQESVRPLAQNLLRLAADQGIQLKIVSAYRSPDQQQALKDSGRGVTNAGALLSYHNHRLAFDVAPVEYLSMPDWNPAGPLWPKVGAIGKSVGLEWGGDWPDKKKDRPHFQLTGAPIRELKSYFEKFGEIMPITITPTTGGVIGIILVLGVVLYLYKDQL
jgi:peptidoglycan L-alanyl-D-glutamate endopeptidase CwlK